MTMPESTMTSTGVARAVTAIAMIVIAVALVVLAASSLMAGRTIPASLGDLYCVTLVNGRVLYGQLDQNSSRALVLSKLYYVQAGPPDEKKHREFKLISQKKSDWHAPEKAIILIDRVLMLQPVDPASQVAKLIRTDETKPDALLPTQNLGTPGPKQP